MMTACAERSERVCVRLLHLPVRWLEGLDRPLGYRPRQPEIPRGQEGIGEQQTQLQAPWQRRGLRREHRLLWRLKNVLHPMCEGAAWNVGTKKGEGGKRKRKRKRQEGFLLRFHFRPDGR